MDLISKQLQNPVYFFLIVESKSKLLNVSIFLKSEKHLYISLANCHTFSRSSFHNKSLS